ncbi:Branchless trichome [Quillaja saponaria]|uniref:Branchless trichome n=1 Tax=Quillaja saponaria TaxID=32244 RepID=A0AAD7PE15_QUISA|nr:Branchless trichome [Quillaja saponaria]
MEEMIIITSPQNPRNETILHADPIPNTEPSWKLYENPLYNSQHNHHYYHQRRCQLPQLSARKLAVSFLRPINIMETGLEFAGAQVMDLKAELEYERKARRKAESTNKRLAKQVAEERRGREAMERVCEKLAKEISSDKAETDRMKREMEEERKMLRMAEVLREERVQMKLSEAKIVFEQKLSEALELEGSIIDYYNNKTSSCCRLIVQGRDHEKAQYYCKDQKRDNDNYNCSYGKLQQQRASPDAENPHIKRGIKGFVEFPRVVPAIGSKGRHWGSTKLECQKAQLRILLKQTTPII